MNAVKEKKLKALIADAAVMLPKLTGENFEAYAKTFTALVIDLIGSKQNKIDQRFMILWRVVEKLVRSYGPGGKLSKTFHNEACVALADASGILLDSKRKWK